MTMSSRPPRLLAMVCAALSFPAVAWANAGSPVFRGNLVGEPVGITDVEIMRETLTIDLRPLVKNDHARVEAIYHLRNLGAEKKLDLLFASGSRDIVEFQVRLGDRPASSQRVAENTPMPESWKPPISTPGLRGEAARHYWVENSVAVAFTIVVPPGEHFLKVRYAAAATRNRDLAPIIHQLAYVLAPARSWSRFGGLDVTIHLPKDWHAACSPAMSRDGDTFAGTFPGLPADAIALTLQAPAGWLNPILRHGSFGLFALAGIGGMYLCGRIGRRRLPSQGDALPSPFQMGIAWGFAIFISGLIAIAASDAALPAGQSSSYGYGKAGATIGVGLLGIVAVPIGYLITLAAGAFRDAVNAEQIERQS